MKTEKKQRSDMRPELFIPPVGFIRTPAQEKREQYSIKSNSIGAFRRHEYDLDICTLYRQMDDLKGDYEFYGGHSYSNYVQQIRENVTYELSMLKMDADFYLDHFYYVLKPNTPAYVSYFGLFLSMSDPLLLVPKLEYHLKLFLEHDTLGRGIDSYFGMLEFSICNSIRAARFPQDYFVKHDRIINWVNGKKDWTKYQLDLNFKLDALIEGINRISPKLKISKEVIRKNPGRKSSTDQEVVVETKMIDILIEDLKGYFNKNNIDDLRQLLTGKVKNDLVLNFDGMSQQLIDVFRIYVEANFIKEEKGVTAKWIFEHFMYKDQTTGGFVPFKLTTVERTIYSTDSLRIAKAIPLSDLPQKRLYYYKSNSKK